MPPLSVTFRAAHGIGISWLVPLFVTSVLTVLFAFYSIIASHWFLDDVRKIALVWKYALLMCCFCLLELSTLLAGLMSDNSKLCREMELKLRATRKVKKELESFKMATSGWRLWLSPLSLLVPLYFIVYGTVDDISETWNLEAADPRMFGLLLVGCASLYHSTAVVTKRAVDRAIFLSKLSAKNIVNIITEESVDWDLLIGEVYYLGQELEQLFSTNDVGILVLLRMGVNIFLAVVGVGLVVSHANAQKSPQYALWWIGVSLYWNSSCRVCSNLCAVSGVTYCCRHTSTDVKDYELSILGAARRHRGLEWEAKVPVMSAEERAAHHRFVMFMDTHPMGAKLMGSLITSSLVLEWSAKFILVIPTCYALLVNLNVSSVS